MHNRALNFSGTGDSQSDSRESFAIETPIFIARQADSHESLEFPICANHPIRANHATKIVRNCAHSWPFVKGIDVAK